MSEELAELKKISKILILANTKTLENELSKYVTTDDRKRVWALINGERMPKEIAQSLGISKRSVERLLKILETAELIENPWGKPPKKILDYTPPSWVELVEVEASKEEEKTKDVK